MVCAQSLMLQSSHAWQWLIFGVQLTRKDLHCPLRWNAHCHDSDFETTNNILRSSLLRSQITYLPYLVNASHTTGVFGHFTTQHGVICKPQWSSELYKKNKLRFTSQIEHYEYMWQLTRVSLYNANACKYRDNLQRYFSNKSPIKFY